MKLEEMSLAELLNATMGTGYFTTFSKLIGKDSDELLLYEGISDDQYYLIEELEKELGYELPSHYIEFLTYLNGGHFQGTSLFSLDVKENHNSLYHRNFIMDLRKKIGLDDCELIIGNYENYIMYVNCEDDDGSYTLMDIKNKKKINFENFSALLGFLFYMLVLSDDKSTIAKQKEDKKRIQEMKEKLHKEVTKIAQADKKLNEKNRAKLSAKVAAKGLKKSKPKKNI